MTDEQFQLLLQRFDTLEKKVDDNFKSLDNDTTILSKNDAKIGKALEVVLQKLDGAPNHNEALATMFELMEKVSTMIMEQGDATKNLTVATRDLKTQMWTR